MTAEKPEKRRSSSKKSQQSESQTQQEPTVQSETTQQEQSGEEGARPTDQAIEDRRQSEIEVERQKRRERLGHFIPGESNPQDH